MGLKPHAFNLETKIGGLNPTSLNPLKNISRGYKWCRGPESNRHGC